MLLLSGLVEGFSLVVATRSVFAGAHAAGLSFREYVVRGMDPTSVAVMLEDAAAVAGLVFAGICSFTSVLLLVFLLWIYLLFICGRHHLYARLE